MISDDEEELSPSSKSIAKPCAVEYCVCSLKYQPEDSELCEGCFYPFHIKCAANRKVIEAYYERYWKPGWQKNYKFYCFICRDFKRSIELYRNDILKSNRAKLLRDFAVVQDNFDNKENRKEEIETKNPVKAASNSVDISSPLSNSKSETNQVKSKPLQKSGVKKLKLKRLRHAQKQPNDQHETKKQVLREHSSPKVKKSSSNQSPTSFVQNIMKRKIKPTDLCLNVQNREKSLNQLKKLDKEMNRATNILKTFKHEDINRLGTKSDQLEANQQCFSISSEDKPKSSISNMSMAPKKRLLMSFKENSHNYPLIRNTNNVIPNKILLAANL